MHNSKVDALNGAKQNAGFAAASAPSTQDADKAKEANPPGQNPSSTLAKDKDLSQQGVQSHKTDGTASDESGKEAAAGEGSQVSGGTPSGSTTGKTGEASSLSAKSNS